MTRSLIASALLGLGFAAGVTTILPTAARAELIKLDMLVKACDAKSAVMRADCEGYVAGVYDMLEDQHAICPKDVRLKNVREMVAGYLGSHHFPADTKSTLAVADALKAGYPCKTP
jgi:hypothetical protein